MERRELSDCISRVGREGGAGAPASMPSCFAHLERVDPPPALGLLFVQTPLVLLLRLPRHLQLIVAVQQLAPFLLQELGLRDGHQHDTGGDQGANGLVTLHNNGSYLRQLEQRRPNSSEQQEAPKAPAQEQRTQYCMVCKTCSEGKTAPLLEGILHSTTDFEARQAWTAMCHIDVRVHGYILPCKQTHTGVNKNEKQRAQTHTTLEIFPPCFILNRKNKIVPLR